MLVLQGELFVASIPFEHFRGGVLKGDWSIAKCADRMGDMSRDEIVRAGGVFALLKPGEMLMVEPGHLLFKCALGPLHEIEPVDTTAVPGSTFLAPRL